MLRISSLAGCAVSERYKRTASVASVDCFSAHIGGEASEGRSIIQSRARSDGLKLLRVINDTQAHGQEGTRADPTRAAHQAVLEVGSERY
jgi:hypothetical protein